MMFRIVFWDVLPCKTIVDRRFRGAYCLQQMVEIKLVGMYKHFSVSNLISLTMSTTVHKLYKKNKF
jgi:hypothetical protein